VESSLQPAHMGPVHLDRQQAQQQGVIMVMTAFFIILLMGVGSLVLDLGRLFILKTQMQNAVDAAALAAVAELDGQAGARTRAKRKARMLLNHKSSYTNDGITALLASSPSMPADAGFDFFSEIDPAKTLIESDDIISDDDIANDIHERDAIAAYVRIHLGTRHIDLFFLPLLDAIGISTQSTAGVSASALAGVHTFVCDTPALMMCDPFEDPAVPGDPAIGSMADAVAAGLTNVGDMYILKSRNTQWAPGDFAFLRPPDPDDPAGYLEGAEALGKVIANPKTRACTSGLVHTATGPMQDFPLHGMNTRFDEYGHNLFQPPQNNAPSPVVIEYPQDSGWKPWDGGAKRFGDGHWGRDDYWEQFHQRAGHGVATPLPTTTQPGISTTDLTDLKGHTVEWRHATRRDIHEWEIRSGLIPCDPYGLNGLDEGGFPSGDDLACPPGPVVGYPGAYPATGDPRPSDTTHPIDGAGPILDGFPADGNMYFTAANALPVSDAARRNILVAVIQCTAQNIHTSQPAIADDFALFFITQRATGESGSKVDYVGEFQGLASGGATPNSHTEAQLHE